MSKQSILKWAVAITGGVGALGAYAGVFGKYGGIVTAAAALALALNKSLVAVEGAEAGQ